MAKAVKRPVAWNPPAGAKLSRNQIFNYRRRAVEHYAHYLGFDLRLDSELLWLAEEGLYAPVPEGYKEMQDLNGTPYYYNLSTKTVTWQHPLDAVYREKLLGMRSIHDLADPNVGKIRTWLKNQELEKKADGNVDTKRRKNSVFRRSLQFVTGSVLLIGLFLSAAYVGLEVWRVRQLMFMPGPILAQVAGALGSGAAAVEAGLVFYNGGGGILQNTLQALAWFQLAADLKDERGLRMAATILFKGEGGVEKDESRAASLFLQAASMGDAFSMSYYGLIHYQGSGVSKNDETALIWTKKGAEAGDPTGMLVFGVMYLEGRSLTRDVENAYKWLLLAKKFGADDSTVQEKVKSYIEYAFNHLGPQQRIDAERDALLFEARLRQQSKI